MLVKVDKFIFLTNFVILDIDDDIEMHLILSWLFLGIVGGIINIGKGKLVLRVGDEKITFKISNAMNHSLKQNTLVIFLMLLIL